MVFLKLFIYFYIYRLIIFDEGEVSVSGSNLGARYFRLKRKGHTHIKQQQQ